MTASAIQYHFGVGAQVRVTIGNWRKGRGQETVTGQIVAGAPSPAFCMVRTDTGRLIGVPADWLRIVVGKP